MIPHPQSAHAVREMERQQTLAEVAEMRRAAQAGPASGRRSFPVTAAQVRLGALLVRVGTRLQGTQGTGSAGVIPATGSLGGVR